MFCISSINKQFQIKSSTAPNQHIDIEVGTFYFNHRFNSKDVGKICDQHRKSQHIDTEVGTFYVNHRFCPYNIGEIGDHDGNFQHINIFRYYFHQQTRGGGGAVIKAVAAIQRYTVGYPLSIPWASHTADTVLDRMINLT